MQCFNKTLKWILSCHFVCQCPRYVVFARSFTNFWNLIIFINSCAIVKKAPEISNKDKQILSEADLDYKEAVLKCIVNGDPRPNISWTHQSANGTVTWQRFVKWNETLRKRVFHKALCVYLKESLTLVLHTSDYDTYASELKLQKSKKNSIIGKYTCNATNSEGTDAISFFIGILRLPILTNKQRFSILKLCVTYFSYKFQEGKPFNN